MTRREEIERAAVAYEFRLGAVNSEFSRSFKYGALWADDNPNTKEAVLINRVKRLTEALEVIKQMGTANTELTHVTASIARKALEEE